MSAYVKIEQQAESSSPKKQRSKKRDAACMREHPVPNVETRAMAARRRGNTFLEGACGATADDKRQRALPPPQHLAARQPAASKPGESHIPARLLGTQTPAGNAVAQPPSHHGTAAPNDGKTRLPVCRNLLFAGGSVAELKPNVHVFPDLACEVHCMLQYIAKSKEGEDYELLFVLQRSGRLVCFKRKWHDEPFSRSLVELGKEVTLVGPQSGVLAGEVAAETSKPPALVRLGNLDKIVVCVDECVCMYESHIERLASGLKIETKLERAFKARLPPSVQSTNARSLAFHPVDKNLYAIGTGDGKIVVQSFHLHDRFQTIPAGASPPLVAFSASGRAFICITAGGGAAARLQTRVVEDDVLAPFSNSYVTREECVDLEDFRKKKAEEKARNKDLLEKWVKEQDGRMSLLAPECLESHDLPQGMPLSIVATVKQFEQRYEDFVLLSWPTELEIWQVRPLQRVGWKKMTDCTCTAVFAFHSRSGRQCWLLGTSLGQVHVISAWATSGEQELCHVKVVDVLPAGSAPMPITSISTLNNASDAQIPQVLFYVGFRDGSVNAHSLADILG